MINTTIAHYRIIKKLGEGGMGEVYLAEDLELDRKVALKFLPPQFTANPDFKARFRREAKAAAALNHPNIVTIYEVGEYQNHSYIAMEYVEGESLGDLISRQRVAVGEAVDIALQICAGLGKAHRAGIVHRDIKPANILIDKEAQIKIVDFGLAKLEDSTKLTQAGTTMGTPHYMSPEQVRGDKLDQRSDIFSVGVVLYELLTGELAFRGEQQLAVLYSITHENPLPLSHHKPGIAAGLQTIVDNALQKDRKSRYQRIEDLVVDLRRERPLAAASSHETVTIFTPRLQPATKPLSRTSIFIRQHGRSAFFTIAALALIIPAALFLPGLFRGKSDKSHSASAKAMLSVSTTPEGAAVFLNGDSAGLTPLNLAAEAGDTIAMRFQKQDYFAMDTSVVITGGRDSTFSFALQPIAQVAITMEPADAEVALNGRTIETSRLASLQWPAGDYDLRISRQGYEPKEEKIVLTQGANPPLHYALKKLEEIAPAPEVGGLEVNSVPGGASVVIADKPRGKTPFADDKLKPGSYNVSIRLEGYEDFSTTVAVKPGKSTPLTATLAPLGELSITSNPDGASVFLDGNPAGTTPYENQKIRAGEHRVLLRKKGHEDFSTSVMVNPRQVSKVEAELAALIGKLSVLVKPFGSIYLDGALKKKDTAVQYNAELPAGTHQLRVVHPKFGAWERTVEIDSSRQIEVPVDFNRIVSVTITSFDESGKSLVGEIVVDNQSNKEFTPKQLKLRIGRHVIEVRRDGYLAAEQVIDLDDNVEEPLRFTLKKK